MGINQFANFFSVLSDAFEILARSMMVNSMHYIIVVVATAGSALLYISSNTPGYQLMVIQIHLQRLKSFPELSHWRIARYKVAEQSSGRDVF